MLYDDECFVNSPCVSYEDPGGGEIFVYRVCPICGRFIGTGELFTDLEGGHVTLKKWNCKKELSELKLLA